MEFQNLSAQHLLQAILSGCENLKQARKKLNEINFFPVADGDTGDNMAATASAIIENASAQSSVEETLESVANASIIGARGNSGMMFSSFFNGLFQSYQKSRNLNTHHFAEMLKNASQQVRSSLMNPMEGTLLTVVENWAKLVENKAKDLTNFKVLCQEILLPLKDALHQHCQYSHQNSEKILDAGALGFYHFIEGFSQAIGEEQPQMRYQSQSVADFTVPSQDHEFSTTPPKNRFCTEALLKDTRIQVHELKKILETFGDSIVVTGHQQLQRFHIHTNQPEKVFQRLQSLGRIANPKIDDMQRQYDCQHCKHRHIALLTDSSADLPIEIRDQHQIHLLPINIHLNEHHLLDPYAIDCDSFYQKIKKNQQYPTTSAPNPLQIQNKFQELSQRYENVLMVSVAEKLSSTYASAKQISQEFSNISVFNSRLTSAAQSLLVYHTAQLLKKPQVELVQVIEDIQSIPDQIEFFVLVNQMDALIRSGRVDKMSGTLANMLHIKPIIKLNAQGQGTMHAKALSKKTGWQTLIQSIQQQMTERKAHLLNYAIVHAGHAEDAHQLSVIAENAFAQKPLYIGPVSAAIGLHAGAGCLGIAAMFSQ